MDFRSLLSQFSLNYEREQKDLKKRINELSTTIDKTKQQELDLTNFIDKVKKYTEIKELTPEIVNELIDKIYVYQQTKLNGKKYQQIDIYYAGVGIIGIPLTEYELENAFQQNIKNAKTAQHSNYTVKPKEYFSINVLIESTPYSRFNLFFV